MKENKKYILKICQLLYKEFILSNKFNESELGTNMDAYHEVREYLEKLGHEDYEESDFLYTCFVKNSNFYNEDILSIDVNQLEIPKLQSYKGERQYYATVQFNETYSMETYLPIIMKSALENYSIDEDDVESEIIDTWDHSIKIYRY
jgi:hypothetical protein